MIDAFYNQSSADLDLWCLVHTRHTHRCGLIGIGDEPSDGSVSVRLMDLSSPSVCTYRGMHIWPNYLSSVWADSSFRAEGDSQETASSLIPPLQIQLSCRCFSLSLLHSLPLSIPFLHCFEFTCIGKIFMVAFSTSPVRPSLR